jgi:hypothetical protein
MPISKKIANKKFIGISAFVIVIVAIGKFIVWDNENNHWLIQDAISKPDRNYKSTIASSLKLIAGVHRIDDASKLNFATPAYLVLVKSKQDI